MDCIDSESVIFNIMNFLDYKSSSQIRRCERRMKVIMDHDIYWGGPIDYSGKIVRECTQPHEPYHVSPGLYHIIMRTSWSGWLCVACGSISNIPVHPFYGTVVCKTCINTNDMYRVMGEKAACKKYFLKSGDTSSISRIQKSHGVFRVLDHQVRKLAEDKLGKDVVATRITKRHRKSETILSNKYSSYGRRRSLLLSRTKSSIMRSRSRVDPFFMDIEKILHLAGFHGIYHYIIGDILDLRVSSRFSIDEVSVKLFDFACFLSVCRKRGILMDDYKSTCPFHDDFAVFIVFNTHCTGGMHFYEYISEYVESMEALRSRSKNVLTFTYSLGNSLSSDHREDICKILCTEEGISSINMDNFDEYIEYGVGDPVMIARKNRKMEFLVSNGYDEYFHVYFNVYRICVNQASSLAKQRTLSNTRGFPIMKRLFVNDKIPCTM